MKTYNKVSLLLTFCLSTIMFAQTNISDINFEYYLETHSANGSIVNIGDANSMGDGVDGNGFVTTSRINTVVSLNVSGLNIADLKGIEAFSALEILICSNNELSEINIANNTNLKSLLCGLNQLVTIDIASNTALEVLVVSDNQISELNVLSNKLLKRITCSDNRIGLLDVSQNINLEFLAVNNNQLNDLNVSDNINLESLFCASNQITTLNLSSNDKLINLNASYNDLSALNLQNGFNNLLTRINSQGNSELNCIQIDNGFTPPDSGWVKDDWTFYSENVCDDIYTYIPDDNFEAYLEANGLGDNVADNNFVLTANISVLTNLPISGNSISDLTGIEGFIALTNLDCSNNDLTSLDLSTNVNLTSLNCSNNILPTIDISNNTALVNLNCSYQTPFVDSENPNNSYVFDTLNLETNASLEILNCSNNAIGNLDFSTNVLLNTMDCSFNQIQKLNLTLNIALTTFNATNNSNLFCIEVNDVAKANTAAGWQKDASANYSLDCGTNVPDDAFENYLETHDTSGGVVTIGNINSMGNGVMDNFVPTNKIDTVVTLNVSNQSIKDLTGIEDFIALTTFNCSFNQIEYLNFISNTALQTLICNDNALQALDVRNGVNNPQLNIFNASNNPNLFCINVDDVTYSENAAGWLEDDPNFYNIDCDNGRYTSIPDNNFEKALIALGLDSGPIDSQVLTSSIEYVLSLNINNKQIEDLTGIQGFKFLEELDCSGNYLNELNVSGMANLKQLNCNSNYLLTNGDIATNGVLNLTGTTSLKKLFCSSNILSNLDLTLNTNLETLDCADNDLDILNISNNSQLKTLNCSNNKLTNLDISNNGVLEEVNCNSNQIANLTSYRADNTTLQILSCSNNKISTLAVDKYLALKSLYCSSNGLSDISLNTNIALEVLDFGSNMISDIDLANNTNIISVSGTNNNLTQIDLNTNLYTFLETINLSNNQIRTLTLNTPNLKYLSCNSNELTSLDLSNKASLIELNVSSNFLSDLVLGNNLNQLKTFNCSNNFLEGAFDLSTIGTGGCPSVNLINPNDFCPDSISINVSNNQIDFVNIQNGINSQISNFNAASNPSLSCIQIDDVNNIGANWLKDATATYSEDCRYGETHVPDAAFEQALMDDITINVDPILDQYVPTSAIEALLTLNINGKNISDLTGIEDFRALVSLDCSDNDLTTLDLSENSNLEAINCSSNIISNLDLSNNVALTNINCSSNTLSNLELTANVNLTNLNISNNNFSIFTPSLTPLLEIFDCSSNLIIDLDFQSNTALTSVDCQSNVLEILNVKNGQNQNLVNFNSQNNSNLTCIETDTGTIPNGVNWLKDTTAEYVINCYYGLTNVPDDAFELALMALGLDDVIDDYVVTANIENISFLNVSNKEISDLTGIEDFISLINLNFEGNTISNIDISSNVVLLNLNASNNILNDLDVSFAPNLMQLDVSNNSLSQLNLDSNTELVELNISNNEITSINIEALTTLEILDCSLNQLEGLDASLNVNLKELYCQSNLFIQDKLNLKNGANQGLTNFNATNNPDLACILVDDPFTVITNETGVYDNWFKDVTSNYQTVCEDADNDGIVNADDQCPGTPFGDAVDLFGCSLFSLPNNNFTVLITGETCLNNNDGKINITTIEYYNYSATLINDNFNKEYHFTNEIDILNLLAGSYQMCITIEEKPDFEICYDVVISQPEPLGVLTSKESKGKAVSINMSGSSSYNIDFNGLKFSTSKSSLTLSLQDGENHINVSTDVECQGIYSETIFASDDVFVYPNPFQENINFYTGNNDNISIKVYSYLGQLVYSNYYTGLKSNEVEVDTSLFSIGIYMVTVETESSLSTFKIVKK